MSEPFLNFTDPINSNDFSTSTLTVNGTSTFTGDVNVGDLLKFDTGNGWGDIIQILGGYNAQNFWYRTIISNNYHSGTFRPKLEFTFGYLNHPQGNDALITGCSITGNGIEVRNYIGLNNTVSSSTTVSNVNLSPASVSPINEIRLGLYNSDMTSTGDTVRFLSECRTTAGSSSRWGYGISVRNRWSLRSYVLNGATVYSTLYNSSSTSDDRLKFNETSITNAIETIRQLNPVTYDKSDTLNVQDNTMHRSGFIAQEVYEIPSLAHTVVQGDETREWSLFYDDIFTHTVAAMKELDSLVQAQQTEIDTLTTQNNLLKSKLNELLSEAGKETIP